MSSEETGLFSSTSISRAVSGTRRQPFKLSSAANELGLN